MTFNANFFSNFLHEKKKINSRYENHSPSTTQGNGTSSTSERDERNGTDKESELNIKNEVRLVAQKLSLTSIKI